MDKPTHKATLNFSVWLSAAGGVVWKCGYRVLMPECVVGQGIVMFPDCVYALAVVLGCARRDVFGMVWVLMMWDCDVEL